MTKTTTMNGSKENVKNAIAGEKSPQSTAPFHQNYSLANLLNQ